MTETRAVLAEIADASRRLSTLVNNLIPEENGVGTVGEPFADAPAPGNRCSLRQRLLERAADQHLRELPAVLRTAERIRRRAGAFVGTRGGGRRVRTAAERLLDAGRAHRRLTHVRQRDVRAAVLWTAATPTSAQSWARRWNLM